MNILGSIAVIVLCLLLAALAVIEFIAEMKHRKYLRSKGIIPLSWGMRIYPPPPAPGEKPEPGNESGKLNL